MSIEDLVGRVAGAFGLEGVEIKSNKRGRKVLISPDRASASLRIEERLWYENVPH